MKKKPNKKQPPKKKPSKTTKKKVFVKKRIAPDVSIEFPNPELIPDEPIQETITVETEPLPNDTPPTQDQQP